MSSPPRILFVAETSAAVEALAAVRQGGAVQGQLAPSAGVLHAALADPDAPTRWDAVVFVPGGPVDEVEVAVFVPDGVPLFVVDDEVPLLLTETAATALPVSDLPTLLSRLGASVPAPSVPVGPDEAHPSDSDAAAGPGPDVDASDASETSPEDADPDAVAADRPEEPLGSEPPTSEAEAPAAPSDGAMPAHVASLADHLSIGLYQSTPGGTILYANPALADLLGVDSVAALDGLDVHADLGYPREAFAEEIARTGVVRNLVVSWTRTTGERVHTRENARSIVDAHGHLVAYEGTMEDVTAEVERRREEQTVARQHRATAGFTAAASLAEDPTTLHCAAAGALLDATAADWAALVSSETARVQASAGETPADLAAASSRVASLTEAPSVVPHTGRGTSALAEVMAGLGVGAYATTPVRNGGDAIGVLVWGYAAAHDVSPTDLRGVDALAWHLGSHLDRVAALQALRDAQASLEAVTEHTPHVLYRLRYTPDGPHYEYLSSAIETLTGLPRSEVEARGGPGGLVETRDVLEGEGLTTGPVDGADAYRAIYRMRTAAGPRWVENAARSWCDASGQPIGLIGVLQDVTDRKAREDELADAAQNALIRQRALVDLAHLDGADAFGGPAAAVVAATLVASGVSFWLGAAGQPCEPLYAPAPTVSAVPFGGEFGSVLAHVGRYRALAVADVATDARVAALGLDGFVRAFGLRAVLIAPIRQRGEVTGFVAVHQTDGAYEWDSAETEFAAAVADAVALALEREDRERLVAELVASREAAEAGRVAAEGMNRLKSAFLANMSHEVRTPLTGILGFAELLREDVPGDLVETVDLISRNGHRLLDTLNAVLDLSRLEAGEYEAERLPTRLAPEVARAVEPLEGAALDKGLRFDLDLDPDVEALIDPTALHAALGHVVGNAIKFTETGGVLISLEATPAAAVLRVADTGRGIGAAFLPEALDAFRQEDTGHARSHEGSGLGLTIARRLVDLLGGEVSLESEQPGGTVVTITLPRVKDGAPPGPRPAHRSGDGMVSADLDLALAERPVAAPTADDPGDLLGAPFDFTFLTSAASAAPTPRHETPPPAPTDMFDFRFGRSPAPDATPQPSPAPAPAAPVPPPPSQPEAQPRTAAPSHAAPSPEAPVAPAEDPVLIIRAKADAPPVPAEPTPSGAPPADAHSAEPAGDAKPTVLVVEDNDDTRMLLERILRSTYDVTAVGDARSALLAMNEQRFTGLVLDINLGGKETGADVLRIARSLPHYDGVFAVALTAYALPGDRERLLESGFSAYISKPFTRQSLMETLAEGVTA